MSRLPPLRQIFNDGSYNFATSEMHGNGAEKHNVVVIYDMAQGGGLARARTAAPCCPFLPLACGSSRPKAIRLGYY